MTCSLSDKKCLPCEGTSSALSMEAATTYLKELQGWDLNESGTEISKTLQVKNYYQVIALVNAIAFIAHQEKHHPDLEVHYNSLRIRYSTHAIEGLSENDFICAAKIDQLILS